MLQLPVPARSRRTRSQLVGSVAGLAAFIALSSKAQASTGDYATKGLMALTDMPNVASVELREDGSVLLRLEDGSVRILAAGEVIVENGVVYLDPASHPEMALEGGSDIVLIGLGVAAVGGAVALLAGGGDDESALPANSAPTISSAAAISVGENSLATGLSVTARDADNDPVTFSITGGADAARFAIDPVSGALRFVAAPDFEAPGDANGDNVFEVQVQATDGTLSATQTIQVTVTNVNDVAPVLVAAGAVTVSENGTAVTTVSALDAEGDAVTFTLSGTDAALFAIDAATGVITFITAPDFENPEDAGGDNVYDLIVTASDGVNTASQAIAVTVTDQLELIGTDGNDVLTGSADNDIIDGLAGDDVIDSLAGTDIVTGGAGADAFLFDQASVNDGLTEDSITDFTFDVPVTTIIVNEAATTQAVVDAALAGNIYFNIHSATFPAGEVRGQLTLVEDNRDANGLGSVTFSAILNGENEVQDPPVVTDAQGTGTVTFTIAAGGVVTYTTTVEINDFDVSTLTVGHLHQAPAGSNGPVVVDLLANAQTNGSIEGSVIEGDRFVLDAASFGVDGPVSFAAADANAMGATIPAGANVIVLLSTDNDGDPATAFNARTAATQIAGLVDSDAPGFFVYSNSGLGVNRLVFSSNLNDPNAPLQIVARLTDRTGPDAVAALTEFSAENFAFDPLLVLGTDGNDVLTGSAESEVIDGLAGDDVIDSLAGTDVVTGGAGADAFLFDQASVNDGLTEDSITDFTFTDDRFVLDAASFGVEQAVRFASVDANAMGATVAAGTNVVVLLSTDNDGNPATPFNARSAARQIAELTSTDGPGFFVYSNSGLGVNRLVFSPNLNDGEAAIQIVARLTDRTGPDAVAALSEFSADNFAFVGTTLTGTDGDDTLIGFGGDDTIIGLAGGDTLEGRGGNDTLEGGDGDDTLVGNLGNDAMFGGAGDDLLVWNNGDNNDMFDGGEGFDIAQVNLQRNTSLTQLDLQNADVVAISSTEGGLLFERTAVNGQSVNGLFNIQIVNSEVLDVNFGGGADLAQIIGSAAQDIAFDLDGGADASDPANAVASLTTGDTLDFSQADAGINLDLDTDGAEAGRFETVDGTATIGDTQGNPAQIINDFENVIGTAFADTLVGNDQANVIEGGAGTDTLTGEGGADDFVFDLDGVNDGLTEDSITDFTFTDDRFLLDNASFNVAGPLAFMAVNGNTAALDAAAGANVIVLLNSDDDGVPATAFNARSAARQIDDLVDSDGAGFFVYSNSALGVNRLVYSENLNDGEAPLQIVARLTDLTGQDAIDALALFSESNFAFEGDAPTVTMLTQSDFTSLPGEVNMALLVAETSGDGANAGMAPDLMNDPLDEKELAAVAQVNADALAGGL